MLIVEKKISEIMLRNAIPKVDAAAYLLCKVLMHMISNPGKTGTFLFSFDNGES